MEARKEELQEHGPRKRKAAQRIEEAKEAVKEAGGRTLHKLHFNLLDGDKELKKRESEVEDAKEKLQAAKARSAEALGQEEKAEMHLRAAVREVENCRARNCHWAMQAAVEATVGMGGYGDLAAAMQYIGATLAANGALHAERAYEQAATFVRSFAPPHYQQKDDPVLAVLQSADSESIATACIDSAPMDWREAEAKGEAAALAMETTSLLQAFETPIVTQEVARMVASQLRKENLPEAWKGERIKLDQQGGEGGGKDGGAKRGVV